jgi:hypothetical protein
MATRDELKSEIMNRIDEAVNEDRELEDNDTPAIANILGVSDEAIDSLIDDTDSEDTEESAE